MQLKTNPNRNSGFMRVQPPPKQIFFSVLFSFYLTGCPRSPIAHPPVAGIELARIESDSILKKLLNKDAAIQSFRGLLNVRAVSDGEVNSFREVIAFRKPGQLRVEALPLNGFLTLSLLVSDDGALIALDPNSKVAIRSKNSEALIREHLRLPAEKSDLMSLFSGTIPTRFLSEHRQIKVFSSAIHFTIVVGDFTEYFLVRSSDLSLEEVQIRSHFDDSVAVTIHYTPSTKSNLHDLDIDIPKDKTKISLKWNSATIGGDVPDKLFRAEIPSDYHVIERE